MASKQPTRRSQAERRASTRAALIRGAMETMRAEGLSNVTVANVCQRAGVSQGALFHYFASLDELASTALDEHFAGQEAQHLLPLREIADPVERIERSVDAVWAMFEDEDAILWLELNVTARANPAFADFLRRADARGADLHLDAAAELFADLPLSRAELRSLVEVVTYGLQGLAVARLHDVDPGEIARVIAALKRVAVAMATATPVAAPAAEVP